jgi:NAD(P)-dependent dehydrogenase (short-subunit alcohol dehydrogenase family)
MSSPSPVLLILGAGPNIGHHVATTFLSHGYKVALASRTTKNHSNDADHKNQIHIAVDLSKPETIPAVFNTVKTQLGAPPSVVVYNGALRIPHDPKDPLLGTSGSSSALALSDHETSMAINNTSVLIAMQQSLAGFRELPATATTPSTASKTFIFTGNILNLVPLPGVLSFGMGKAATAYAIRCLVEQKVYEAEGVTYVSSQSLVSGFINLPLPLLKRPVPHVQRGPASLSAGCLSSVSGIFPFFSCSSS